MTRGLTRRYRESVLTAPRTERYGKVLSEAGGVGRFRGMSNVVGRQAFTHQNFDDTLRCNYGISTTAPSAW